MSEYLPVTTAKAVVFFERIPVVGFRSADILKN
jgi:hypothetical protein